MPATAREALRHFGIAPRRARRVQRGRNAHWIVATRTGRVVLRRYATQCTVAEVSYELHVLEYLARRGWPVPAPVAPPLAVAGRIWCLFPYLDGRAPAPRSPAGRRDEQRRRGRLLARLHADLADLAGMGQRPGWRRADEGLFERASPTERVLRRYERRQPEPGRVLRDYAGRMRERLAELLPAAPAPIVIHGDLTPWNLKYAAGHLSGVLDFDAAHLDLRVADFALSWRGRDDDVVRGYEEESPLQPVERDLLVPVYWAWMLACAVTAIEDGVDVPTWALDHLVRRPA